jgi:hypothetical protein
MCILCIMVKLFLSLVLCPTYSAGLSLVAAGHLLRQKSSTYFNRSPFSSLHITYWHGEITQHYPWDKALVSQRDRHAVQFTFKWEWAALVMRIYLRAVIDPYVEGLGQ